MNHSKSTPFRLRMAAALLAALILTACSPADGGQNSASAAPVQQAESAEEPQAELPSEESAAEAASEESTALEEDSNEEASSLEESASEETAAEENAANEETAAGEQATAETAGEEPASAESEVSAPTTASTVWQTDAPENHNMDPAVLADLHAALPGSSVLSMVTVKDGVIIDEYYRDGYDEQSLYRLNSASKSFTGALIGIAIEQGYIGGVDDLLSDYLPQVLEQQDTRKHQITLEHLLTHTSGLEWYEWGSGYTNWSEFQNAPNWVDYILNRNLVYEPGTQFAYSTGNTHLLSAVIEAATGMTAEEYARINLFEPLGIENWQWDTDPQGITDGGNGLHLSTRDAARFGQLFLQNGQWNGQQLVPAEWVETSTTAKNGGAGDGTGSYGYQWWTRTYHSGGYSTYTPPYGRVGYTVYYALGHGGQFLFVVPELNLVCAITSQGNSTYAPRPFFTDYILSAYMG